MNRRWKEVRLVIPVPWLEAIAADLQALGFSGLWIDEPAEKDGASVIRCYLPETEWHPDVLGKLNLRLNLLSRFFACEPPSAHLDVKTIEEEDWASKWLPFFTPFQVGHVWIRSSRKSVRLKNGEQEIIIDPGQAFGTGHHETSRLCMEAILRLSSGSTVGADMLDLGTGTAILAMFAVMVGLKDVIAADIDPSAVETAQKNLARNGMSPLVHLFTGSLNALRARFDLIVANLSFSALTELSGMFAERLRKGGQVVVSGFLQHELEPLSEAFSAQRLRCVEVRTANEWVCGTFQKRAARSGVECL